MRNYSLVTIIGSIISRLLFDIIFKFLCYFAVYKLYLYLKPKLWRNKCKMMKSEMPESVKDGGDGELLQGLCGGDGDQDKDDLCEEITFVKSLGNFGKNAAEDLKKKVLLSNDLPRQNQNLRKIVEVNSGDQDQDCVEEEDDDDFIRETQQFLANVQARKLYGASSKLKDLNATVRGCD